MPDAPPLDPATGPEIMRVGKESVTTDVASSITKALRQSEQVALDGVGPDALSTIAKALATATTFLGREGITFVTTWEWIELENRTASGMLSGVRATCRRMQAPAPHAA